MAKKKNTEVVTEDQTIEIIENNEPDTKQDEVKKEDIKPVEKKKVKEQKAEPIKKTNIKKGPNGKYASEDFINF